MYRLLVLICFTVLSSSASFGKQDTTKLAKEILSDTTERLG